MTATTTKWLQGVFAGLRRRTKTAAGVAYGGDRQRPVSVYTAANAMEAGLVKALLESEGVPAYAAGEAVGSVFGFYAGALAEVEVMVMSSLAPRARPIIEAWRLAEDSRVEGENGGDEAEGRDEADAFSSDI